MDVVVREMGLRDSLQGAATLLPTEDKLAWIAADDACSDREMAVTSFVSPKLLPQFADSTVVVAGALTHGGLRVSALVPNLRGAQDAVVGGAHEINTVIAASEGHNQSNLCLSTDRALEAIARIVEFHATLPAETRPQLCAGVATAFGCTINGVLPKEVVRDPVRRIRGLGVELFLIADTVGYADPAAVRRLFRSLRRDLGENVALAAHFHDTRGTRLAKVVAALEAEVRAFNANLGGCPYSPDATGNIPTWDLVHMPDSMGLRTGIDVERLLDVRA